MSMREIVIVTCDQCKNEMEMKASDTESGEWIHDMEGDFCSLKCKEEYYTKLN